MSNQNLLPVPEWVAPEQRLEFTLRLAALYFTMGGSLNDLSRAMGRSQGFLHMALTTNRGLTAEACIELEDLLGRENFPREFFRPDIFIAE